MKPAAYADIRSFVRAALERRERESDGSRLRPSEYWKSFAENFALGRGSSPAPGVG